MDSVRVPFKCSAKDFLRALEVSASEVGSKVSGFRV